MNPSFRFFDLNIYGPLVTRQDELTIKYWAQTEKMEEFLLLIELRVNLRSLQFIGKTVRYMIPLYGARLTLSSLKASIILFHRTAYCYTFPTVFTQVSQTYHWMSL